MRPPVLGVHGIGNYKGSATPEEAAAILVDAWRPRLATGYQSAHFDDPPDIAAVYYADLLADGAQGGFGERSTLTPEQQRMAQAWMMAAGAPVETAQGEWSVPVRQGLDWLARKNGRTQRAVARVMGAFLSEVYAYMTRPPLRRQARERVIEMLDRHQPKVVVAHSLGSVVAFEALHQRPDITVELLVTLGSPLGLPVVIFDGLDPAPRDGKGVRPPGVRRWVNIADRGDLVAVPRELGGRFDVDLHGEAHISSVDFHLMGNYLANKVVAAAIMPYA